MDHYEDGFEHHAKQEDRETFDCLKEIKKLVEAKLDLPPLVEMRMISSRKNCCPWRNFMGRPGENIDSSTLPEVLSLAKGGLLKHMKRRTPLHEAALGNHLKTLYFLIDHGADLNARTLMGLTALHLAVEAGSLSVISCLISQGLDVNATSHFGTPLWLAAIENQEEAMQTLLRLKANPNICSEGMLPLHASILASSHKCVHKLLSVGADPNIMSCRISPLKVALILRDTTIVELLLSNGAIPIVEDDMRKTAEEVYSLYKLVGQKAYDAEKYHTSFVWYTQEAVARLEEIRYYNESKLNLPSFEEIRMLIRAKMAAIQSSNLNPEKIAPSTAEKIFNAVRCGDIAELRRLISKIGVKRLNLLSNMKIEFGVTIIHLAAGMGHIQICEYLIEKLKFDIDIKDSRGCTPLHTAAIENVTGTSSYLIDHGADLYAETFMGQTVLHLAAEAGSVDVMSLLISEGFYVNVPTSFGTALCSAVIHNQEEAMRILLSAGANPNGSLEATPSPLHDCIVMRSSYKTMELLLSGNADPNMKSLGFSPLETTIRHGDIRVLELLLKSGADPNKRGDYDLLPLEFAALQERKDMVEKLFPMTSPISYIEDWSVDGITKYYHSKEVKKKKAKRDYLLYTLKGEEAYMAGRYEAAGYWYSQAMKANRSDKTCMVKRCLCWIQMGDAFSAKTDTIAMEREPGWAEAIYVDGLVSILHKKFEKAAKHIEEACEVSEKTNGRNLCDIGGLSCHSEEYILPLAFDDICSLNSFKFHDVSYGDVMICIDIVHKGLYRKAIDFLKAPPVESESAKEKINRQDIVALARGGYAEVLCIQQNRKSEGERMKKWAECAWRNRRLSLAEALEFSDSSKVMLIDTRINRAL